MFTANKLTTAFAACLSLLISSLMLGCQSQDNSVNQQPSVREAAQSQPVNQQPSIQQEAYSQAEAFWKGMLTKCGDSYYWFEGPEDINHPSGTIYEGKGTYQVKVEGSPQQQRPLTQAEILNGVKPSGVQYVGSTTVKFEVMREASTQTLPPYIVRWGYQDEGRWIDNFEFSRHLDLIKENGQWRVKTKTFYGTVRAIKCSDIANPQ